MRKEPKSAEECFRRALALDRTAKHLAALACAVASREESDMLNREALILDPNCDIARKNLERP